MLIARGLFESDADTTDKTLVSWTPLHQARQHSITKIAGIDHVWKWSLRLGVYLKYVNIPAN